MLLLSSVWLGGEKTNYAVKILVQRRNRHSRGNRNDCQPSRRQPTEPRSAKSQSQQSLQYCVGEYANHDRLGGDRNRDQPLSTFCHRDSECIHVSKSQNGARPQQSNISPVRSNRMDCEQYDLEQCCHLQRGEYLERIGWRLYSGFFFAASETDYDNDRTHEKWRKRVRDES